MTPAYPILKHTSVSGIMKANMSLFNSREDVEYYQIDLFDLNWINMPFSSKSRIIKVSYKERKDFVVYLRKIDLDEATYICTTSKLIKNTQSRTMIISRICSRIDGEPA
tara:strand:+ start:2001 stop:2327 length:327 start_codon:yes stop_codon:yes gene_type:complete